MNQLPSDRLPLHRLIRIRMDNRGWSYGDLVRRSRGKLTKGRWQQLATQTRMTEFPKPATLRAIADVLEVDESTVLLSAATSVGIDARLQGPILAQLLPAGTELLSDHMRDAILGIIRAAVAEAMARNQTAELAKAKADD